MEQSIAGSASDKPPRRWWSRWLIAGAIFALVLTPGIARADGIAVYLDGQPLSFDVPPITEQDRTLVPLRAILTPLGASFRWDEDSQSVTVTLGGTQLFMVVGSTQALVNGQPVTLPVPVRVLSGHTMLPLRFLSEEYGLAVEWDEESQSAFLWSPGADRSRTVSRGTERRIGDVAAARAAENIGAPYAWGGTTPETGFDCSGFVVYLAGLMGQELPHTSYDQFTVGVPVSVEELAAGDLVFYSTYDDGASHVGIYDGAGGFIHAQSAEVGVVRTSVWNPWWSARYLGARRVFR